jgi:hypothetical protein
MQKSLSPTQIKNRSVFHLIEGIIKKESLVHFPVLEAKDQSDEDFKSTERK